MTGIGDHGGVAQLIWEPELDHVDDDEDKDDDPQPGHPAGQGGTGADCPGPLDRITLGIRGQPGSSATGRCPARYAGG